MTAKQQQRTSMALHSRLCGQQARKAQPPTKYRTQRGGFVHMRTSRRKQVRQTANGLAREQVWIGPCHDHQLCQSSHYLAVSHLSKRCVRPLRLSYSIHTSRHTNATPHLTERQCSPWKHPHYIPSVKGKRAPPGSQVSDSMAT